MMTESSLASASSLIFKSNFGSGVSLSVPYGFSTYGAWQDLKGLDQETGYSWPVKALNANFSGVQMISYYPIATSTVDSYIHNEIRSVTGPLGTPVNELFQTVKQKPLALGSAQAPLLIRRSHTAGDVADLYISYWFKIQPDIVDKLDSSVSSGNWRSIFEFKTGGTAGDASQGDYRIQTTIIKGADGKLYWMNKGDNVANGPYARVDYWIVRNYTVPIPIDKWFKFEVYWHRSAGTDGRYWAAVNGQVLVDRFGANMGIDNDPINRIFINTTYSGGNPTVDSHTTGLEIWNGFPCGVGVSCYGASIAPKVNIPLLDQAWTESTLSNFIVPANTFVDPDGGAMMYSATLSSGAALPAWLSFSPVTRTFTGTPPKEIATYSVRVTATDGKGLKAYDDFKLKVNNTPKLNLLLSDQVWTEGLSTSYTIPSTAFSDPDADILTYTALLSSGAALPTWMKFDPVSRVVSGTPPRAVASYTIRVTAKDPYGLFVYDDFVIKINNKPSIGAYIPDLIWNENYSNDYTIATGFYKDIDGDPLTYTATLSSGEALPTWMSFNASTQVFTGIPPRGIATFTIKVRATDPLGLFVEDSFDIRINNKPTVITTLTSQSWPEGKASTFTVPSNTFGDIDGDALTYSATLATGAALPTWMSFNASTRTLTGAPPVGSSNFTVRVRVVDAHWLFVFTDVVINTP